MLINIFTSNEREPLNGVPQSSDILINESNIEVEGMLNKFADDTKLLVNTLEDRNKIK